jgi:uncharacterized RDD family membrane protein YckC
VTELAAADARTLQGRRAGTISRLIADAVDFGVVLAGLGVCYLGVAAARFLIAPRRFHWPTPGTLVLSAFGWALLIGYLTVAWSTTGRSVGKQMMGLRVERRNGSGLGIGIALARAVLCAAFPIGLFWSLFSRESASVHDLIVRTKVVYDWVPRVPASAAGS